ncbi:helix-turn-helix domain-containing protein [Kribbella kalugense]|uniref:helix-turn-helix domain-containing protein n=1 Tax=Kribbella kalugense TaxID=2512221 RepID=UPI001EE08C15|nr:XRE family transcriptional regulator [Kribbella kalugense]
MSRVRGMGEREFADVLRAAIQARGLGLERIRERLLAQGVSVSLATLSYWQSGRSRPERRDSLAAVELLEAVLEVPNGTLSASLGPPRRRGRWLSTVPDRPELAAYWPRPDAVEEAVSGVDIRWDERLTRISQHDRVFIGPDRGERAYHSRQVLRAEADGPDRWVVIMHLDEHDRPLPEIRPLRHCRLGRTVRRPADGLLVAELLFDRPLRKGETVITEHELVNVPPYPPATNYERKFRLPVREFVLELCFEPGQVPASCVGFSQLDDEDELVRPVDVEAEVHGVVLNFGPGRYGFRWTWPE